MFFVIAAACVLMAGVAVFLILRSSPPHATRASSVPEQTIELPVGQRLLSAEIGAGGEVSYRHAPLQAGEQPRNSTVEGRSSGGRALGKVHFIERAAE